MNREYWCSMFKDWYYSKLIRALLVPVLLWTMAGPQSAWTANSPIVQGDGVLKATLDNGLRVVIVRNPLSGVATTVINYLAGSDESPEGFPGMAHAQEHMMFRGSKGLSADQLAAITASMGGMFNADTTRQVTQYFFTVPAEDLDVALHIEAIRMRSVLDSEELWSKERGAIEQEVAQDLSIPEYVFSTRLFEAMFKGTPYEHDALGTRASFDKTTGAMLKKFHDSWYAPNNAILVIAGDVKPGEVLSEVRHLFEGIPSRKLPPRPDVSLQPVIPQTIELITDRPEGMAVVAFRMPGYESRDCAAAYVLADVLDSQRGSLYALLLDGKALSVDFQVTTLPEAGIGYAVASFPKGEDGRSLAADMTKIITSIKNKGVPADLVEAAKRHRITDAELEKNSVFGLAMAWSRALAVEGRSSPADEVDAIRKVTLEDVNRVAREYLDVEHSLSAVLTPQSSGSPEASKGSMRRESFTPERLAPVTFPNWADRLLKRLPSPHSRLNPVVSILPNGIKLIVQRVSASTTVSVYGHVRNTPYLEEPHGKEGVHDVLDKLFSYGTTSLDRVAFLKAVDDIGAYESAGTDFSLQVLSDQLDRGLQLLADSELHPALPENDFETVQRQNAAAVAGLLKSPGYLAERAVNKALLPEHDPTLREATPETISSLTIQDVRGYYRTVIRPDMATIVVMGDITPEKARTLIEKHFGSWKAPDEPKPETLLKPVPPNKPAIIVVPNASRVQDSVTLAETLGLDRSNPDYYALQLGNHVLGGAFYATRLSRDLREHAGLVYHVASSFDVDQTRSVYSVEYACDPPNVRKARAIVEHDLKDMLGKPVSAEELFQAKAMLLRKIPLSESDVQGIAGGFIRRTELDLPLDEPNMAAQRYLKLTAGQVRDAFSRWIRIDDLVQVIEGPNPQ